ncbi:hypothetical protein HDU96_007497 [Phlyctochytrium bullatum]|nr:hypothetical protein HDU96_007497 [Phlyctochytrium bullatum]
MSTVIALAPATLADVDAMAGIFTAAFASDIHTQMKVCGKPPNDMENGMKGALESWIQTPDRRVATKAIDTETGEMAGWVVWGSFGYLPAPPKPNTPAPAPDQPQPELTDPIKRLEALTNADMKRWIDHIMPDGVKCMYIIAISVHPTYQGRGVGSALIRKGTEKADEDGVFCWVHASEAGHRAFAKAGFEERERLTINLDDYAPERAVLPAGRECWGEYTFRYMVINITFFNGSRRVKGKFGNLYMNLIHILSYEVTYITAEGDKRTVYAKDDWNLLDIAHTYDIELEGHVVMEQQYYDKLEEPSDEENDMLDLAFGLTETGSAIKKGGKQRTPQELLTAVNSIVKNRSGTVLSRQTILKSDHFETAVNNNLDFHLQGAPNFRMADLNIFGVAQPTVSGIGTILTLLNCRPETDSDGAETVFICAREEPLIYLNRRPFVLRDNNSPFQNIKTFQGIAGHRLEQMEARLKEEVLREVHKNSGLLLVHEEVENGRIIPSWMAIDDIKTIREVFEEFQHQNFRVKYVRIPISAEQAPEDRYLDEYIRVIGDASTKDPLVFNCGMGVGRTTFAMVVALLIRRATMIEEGEADPFISVNGLQYDFYNFDLSHNRAILRLVYVLERGLSSKMSPRSAIDWALARGALIDDLKNAVLGNYQCILQLTSVLQDGVDSKRLLDEAINRCDVVLNLREVILLYRVKFSTAGDPALLEKAMGCLERYFFLLAFCSYVSETVHSNFKDDLSVFSEDAPSWSGWNHRPNRPIANELEKFVIKPHVLREETVTLRNIKSYSGISTSRLEQIENRLKEDVIHELRTFDNRILLHGEQDSKIVAAWEDCMSENVLTVKEVTEVLRQEGLPIDFYRVPVTAEQAPDEADFDALVQILTRVDLASTSIVLNCQVGIGRSTTGTVVCSLILQWLQGARVFESAGNESGSSNMNNFFPSSKALPPPSPKKPLTYQVIHSLLRVIRNGMECRKIVDDIIDRCAFNVNIRDAIEYWRGVAEAEQDEVAKARAVKKGMLCLRRYFALIAFSGYLDDNPPNDCSTLETFKSWMGRRKEFETMLEELENSGLKGLIPVEQLSPGDGIALSSEVLDVVTGRNGSVLAKQTILKADVFPGAQKISLPERVEGAPNFRRIPMQSLLDAITSPHVEDPPKTEKTVYGIGMPTKDAIRLALTRNLEATGIARERVESMEAQMKQDCINELTKFKGRLLLHEEQLTNSGFSIVPVWETVSVDEIETPLEVYNSIIAEGFQVDYKRIPITDEQAPIPDVFDQLIERVVQPPDPVSTSYDVMFNCQMGRGRTTTGIVTTCLLEMILGRDKLVLQFMEHQQQLDADNYPPASASSLPTPITPSASAAVDEDHRMRERYLAGEYKLVLQLLGVLENGRLAKKLTDKAVDLCDHMQNLRSAIYDYKLRVEALEVGSRKYTLLKEVAINYLVRYVYLIIFADFLLEERSGAAFLSGNNTFTNLDSPTPGSDMVPQTIVARKFSEWLDERREIQNICKKTNQTLD